MPFDWFDFEIPTYFWYSLGPSIAVLAYIYNLYVRTTCGKFTEEVVKKLNFKFIMIF